MELTLPSHALASLLQSHHIVTSSPYRGACSAMCRVCLPLHKVLIRVRDLLVIPDCVTVKAL
jgi:hypothetical protein